MTGIPFIRLSDLAGQIEQSITSVFGGRTFWIVADVADHTYKQAGNFHYFQLVEKAQSSGSIVARAAARAWGNAALNIRNFEQATGQQFKNDINVLVQVSVQYTAAFGLQLSLIDIDTHFTLGKFEQQRKATLDRLLRDNPLFIRWSDGRFVTRNAELALKPVLQRIAVISSETSAGYQDFRHTLENNGFGYHFELDNYFALVQGEGNAAAFLQKLIAVFQSGKPYDALVIIRGGGAQSDFLIFDNYELNRALAKFPIPVITGIGHQKNETITDLMAHTSTKTPTKAAEFLIAHNRTFEQQVLQLQQQLLIRTFQLVSAQKEKLNRLNQQTLHAAKDLLQEKRRALVQLSAVMLSRPGQLLSDQRKDLAHLQSGLVTHSQLLLERHARQVQHFAALVRLMSPENILRKGFALLKVNGKIVADAGTLHPGDDLEVILSGAALQTRVTAKKDRDGREFNL